VRRYKIHQPTYRGTGVPKYGRTEVRAGG
jgi:hypothetical protein